jgi:hypothetical protein
MTVSTEDWNKFLEIAGKYCRDQGAVSVERCHEHEACLIVLMPQETEEKHMQFVLGQKQ